MRTLKTTLLPTVVVPTPSLNLAVTPRLPQSTSIHCQDFADSESEPLGADLAMADRPPTLAEHELALLDVDDSESEPSSTGSVSTDGSPKAVNHSIFPAKDSPMPEPSGLDEGSFGSVVEAVATRPRRSARLATRRPLRRSARLAAKPRVCYKGMC
mgnify:CR=1 FL=1